MIPLKELLLNTPEKYWIIMGNYHFHKSSIGILLLLAAGMIYYFKAKNEKLRKTSLLLFAVGILLILLSILGNIYTNRPPYFELWEKYP